MNALVPQIKEIVRGAWQGRWVGLIVAWIVAIGGAAYVFVTPDRYEASARVYVDTQSILKPLMAGMTVQPDVEQEVAILSRTLISRPNLQKLVRMTDMDLNATTGEQRERIIDGLTRTLYIRSLGRDNLYTIGHTDPKPEQAQRVVQSLLSIFVESGLTAKSNDTGQAKRFIEEQIKAYEQRLIEAENRVKEFKLANLDLDASVEGGFFGNLASVMEKLRQARQDLQEASRSRDILKQQIADEEARTPSAPQPEEPLLVGTTPELDDRINILGKNLDEMLLRYTDNHPDVLNTRRIIKELEGQRNEERKRLTAEFDKRRQSAGVIAGPNAVVPQLKIALVEAEAQIAALRARVTDFERRHALLVDRARSVPEREAKFTQLTRDYAIQKQNYESLVARRESAFMSGEMEAATGVADFKIVDPPRVSPNPVAPNRKMLIPLVLLASLCAGLAASYGFSIVHPTFYDGRGLRRVGHRPVLGSISLVANPLVVAKRRRQAWLFFGGLGGVAATYGAALALVFLRPIFPF